MQEKVEEEQNQASEESHYESPYRSNKKQSPTKQTFQSVWMEDNEMESEAEERPKESQGYEQVEIKDEEVEPM